MSKRINVRPLKPSSLLAFEQYVKEHNWSAALNFNLFFPVKSVKVHEDDKPYINGRIKHLIRKRDKAYQSGRVEQHKIP